MSDPERALLSCALRAADMTPVISAGIGVDDLEDDEHRNVLRWMYDHFHRFQGSPGLDALRSNFPAWKLDDPSDGIDFYIAAVRVRQRYNLMQDNVARITSELKNDERSLAASVEAAQAVFQSVTTDLLTEYAEVQDEDITLEPSWGPRIDFYDDLRANPGQLRGYRTGFRTIDIATRGIQPGQFIVIAGVKKSGKAQPHDELVLTPTGWVRMGDIQPGDQVVNSDGCPTVVVAVQDWNNREIVRVSTDDGASVLVDAAHDWTVYPNNTDHRERIVSTELIRAKLEQGDDKYAYLPVIEPVQLHVAQFDVDPWLIGALLGDGNFGYYGVRFTKRDVWMHDEVRRLLPAGASQRWIVEGLTSSIRGANRHFRKLGMMGKRGWEKTIPEPYLRGSASQRRALLAGLLDTDGGMSGRSIEFSTSSEELARQVQQLVWSLGGCVTVTPRVPRHQNGIGRTSYRMNMRLSYGNPFRLPRKREIYEQRTGQVPRRPSRRIVSIETVATGPTRCLQVRAKNGLYVTRDYLVTHNSTLELVLGITLNDQGARVLMFNFEMSDWEMKARHDARRARIDPRRLLDGRSSAAELDRLEKALKRAEDGFPFTIVTDQEAQTTVSAVAAKIAEHKPDVALVDGAYLMEDEFGEPPGTERAQRNISRGLARTARRTGVPIVATTQALEAKVNKRVGITSFAIGYTSAWAQDATTTLLLQPVEDPPNSAELRVGDSRSGPKATSMLTWDFTTMTFEERFGDIDGDAGDQDGGATPDF